MLIRPRSSRAGREEGSIAIAVMIILILVLIGSALAFAVIGNESIVTTRQENAQSISLADAGISDALFRLDQGGTQAGESGGTFSSFCVNGSGCVGSSIPGAPNVSYVATPNNSTNPSKWTIDSKGVSNGQPGAVEESVTRTSQFPFALFTTQQLRIDGISNTTWGTYSSNSSIPDPNQNVGIGSDGVLACKGNLPSNVLPSYYQANGSTTGAQCGSPMTTDYTYPVPTGPATNSGCPNGGQLGSGASPAYPSIPAGTYLCTQPVTITGQLTVASGQVNLYIILTPPAPSGDTTALALAGGNTYVNDAYDYCINVQRNSASQCLSTYGMPNSQNFQVFTNTTLDVGDTNGKGVWFGGILDAPQAGMVEDGCKGNFYGAIILANFTCNGGSAGFHLYYDYALSQDYGPWIISGYREIPPTSVVIP